MINILAVSGSLKATSTNTLLLRAMMALAPAVTTINLFNGIADLPHFSPDLDTESVAQPVRLWRTALHDAQAVIICTPEYAYGMPGSLKNALDWTVSSGEFMAKPVAVLSASPNAGGGKRAHDGLIQTLTALSASIVEPASLIVPRIRSQMDESGAIYQPELLAALRSSLAALIEAIPKVS